MVKCLSVLMPVGKRKITGDCKRGSNTDLFWVVNYKFCLYSSSTLRRTAVSWTNLILLSPAKRLPVTKNTIASYHNCLHFFISQLNLTPTRSTLKTSSNTSGYFRFTYWFTGMYETNFAIASRDFTERYFTNRYTVFGCCSCGSFGCMVNGFGGCSKGKWKNKRASRKSVDRWGAGSNYQKSDIL